MRGKAFAFQPNGMLSVHAPEICPLTTARGIMTRDFNDCIHADLVFANFLDAKFISIGTCMEMAFAYTRQIPVIAVIEEGNPHANHPMLEETFSFRVPDLSTGKEIALSFLLP
jgi:nucleoside 2-deoxyribosyltransferase